MIARRRVTEADVPEWKRPRESVRILDAVARWAWGAWMLREIELIAPGPEIVGRLDALLVPGSLAPDSPLSRVKGGWCWSARRLIGVEVKVTRADFFRGVEHGQFDRYPLGVGAVYLAVPRGLLKPSEVPAHVGILVVRADYESGWREDPAAVCVRRAKVNDNQPAPEMFWRILAEVYRKSVEDRKGRETRVREALERFGHGAARVLSAGVES